MLTDMRIWCGRCVRGLTGAVLLCAAALAAGCGAPGRRVAPLRPGIRHTASPPAPPAATDTTGRTTDQKNGKQTPARKVPRTKKPVHHQSPSPEKLREVARAYREGEQAMAQNRLEVAAQYFESVYQSVPKYKDIALRLRQAYLFLGMEHYTEGEPERAIDVWSKVLSIDPNDEKALAYIRKTKQEIEKIKGLPGGTGP